jgi:hypothetical protein
MSAHSLDAEIRLEALRFAARGHLDDANTDVERAEIYYRFLRGGPASVPPAKKTKRRP